MANQVIVTSNNTVQVSIEPTPNVEVTISRTAVGTIANVLTANYANFAGEAFSVDGANVNGAVANATYALNAGNANTANIANIAYSVDGANVSGAVANATYAANAGNSNIATTAGTVTSNAQPNITSLGNLNGLTSTANIIAPYFIGNVVGNISGNIVVPGLQGDVLFNDAGNAGASGNLNYNVSNSSLNVIGNVNATNFNGNGSGLSAIAGANVTGTVANATYALNAGNANFANTATTANTANIANIANVAYSVDGANVTGTVANATYALNAGNANFANTANIANVAYSVDGANVTGTVANATYAANAGNANFANTATTANIANIANVAYSVDGANVSGTVANATYAANAGNANFANSATVANSANSVTLANVSGAGNIASINLTGSNSNVLYGNGAFAAITSIGALSANLDANSFSIVNLGAIDFDTAANIVVSAGQLAWNSSDGTLDLGLKGGNVVLQIGQEQLYEVRNDTGNVISLGTAVYASGVTPSGRIEVSPYVANNTIDSKRFLGLASENITTGINGFVTQFGYVRDLDTRGTANTAISVGDETWAAGDILWAHPTAAGKLTKVEPAAPNNKISVAIIIIRNQTSGVLFVRPTANPKLEDIQDVGVNGVVGDVLVYDGNIWQPSNTVPVANTAYSVDGANVSGTVANATFALDAGNANIANIAYSVDVSNVANIGNIATINLDGNVSNLLTGNGTFVAIPTVSANANYANFAGQVIDATQSNITTVGTLTDANVSNTGSIRLGNIIINETGNVTNRRNQLSVIPNVVDGNFRAITVSGSNITDITGITDAQVFSGGISLISGSVGSDANRISTTTQTLTTGGAFLSSGTVFAGNNAGATVSAGSVGVQGGSTSSLEVNTQTSGGASLQSGTVTFANANTVSAGGVSLNSGIMSIGSNANSFSAGNVTLGALNAFTGTFSMNRSNGTVGNVRTSAVTLGSQNFAINFSNGVSNITIANTIPVGNMVIRSGGGIGHASGNVTGGNLNNISVGNITTQNIELMTGSFGYPGGSNVSNYSAGNVTTGGISIFTGTATNVASVTGTLTRGDIRLNGNRIELQADPVATGGGTGTFTFDSNSTATLGNLVVSNNFSGNGSLLTGILANNVTGLGNIASINLDGNVSNLLTGNGTFVAIPTNVANANYANFAGTATTANSANSVTLANVSGAGNIASINLNGNANTYLDGTGTWSIVSTWDYYAINWSTAPVQVGTTLAGDVYSYVLGATTRYRLVPTVYNPVNDSFYLTFTGGVLSNLIVSRG